MFIKAVIIWILMGVVADFLCTGIIAYILYGKSDLTYREADYVFFSTVEVACYFYERNLLKALKIDKLPEPVQIILSNVLSVLIWPYITALLIKHFRILMAAAYLARIVSSKENKIES